MAQRFNVHGTYKVVAAVCFSAVFLCLSLFAVGLAADKKPVDPSLVKSKEQKYQELEKKRQHFARKKQENLRKAQQFTRKIVTNQRNLYKVQRKLRSSQTQLVSMRNNLESLSSELDETIGATARYEQDVAKRLRQLYMGGRVTLLQMIFESAEIARFLDSLYFKQRLVAKDKQMLVALKQRKQDLASQKQRLAQQKVQIYGTIEDIKKSKSQYDKYINRDRQQRNKYKKDAAYYERAEKELLRESSVIQNELAKLTGKKSTKAIVSTGKMIWPVTGFRVTSNFGYRRHPIHRKRIMHTGLDLAKPRNTPVKAADSGTVIHSGWRGGYGKVVMINHGNRNGQNIVTLYAHLQSTSVRKGQKVSKGNIVGKVGSTGYSTGPHLHFEVRRNGKPVNPRSYLP